MLQSWVVVLKWVTQWVTSGRVSEAFFLSLSWLTVGPVTQISDRMSAKRLITESVRLFRAVFRIDRFLPNLKTFSTQTESSR